MATSSLSGHDPLSSVAHGQTSPPQSAPSTTTSRRLPPPCWSPDETVALIDAYREKWYSLRRGHLRASHWQEVADAVAVCCPVDLPKTSVQCRHKMEKLRKRYRAELQRSNATPSGRYCSSWVHFKRMDFMEKGPTAEALPLTAGQIDRDDDDAEDDDDQEDQEEFYGNSFKQGTTYSNRGYYGSMGNGIGGGGGAGANGFRIRIPGRPSMGLSMTKSGNKYEDIHNLNPNFNLGTTSKVCKDGYVRKHGLGKRGVGERNEGGAVGEMVAAIKVLGDGFVRMEKMKMEMAREVEAMRMEMEMKRTEMILESQQRIVDAFVKAFSEKKNKKVKRVLTPES